MDLLVVQAASTQRIQVARYPLASLKAVSNMVEGGLIFNKI